MKVSDYNLILILTGMILGLAGQLYNNYNLSILRSCCISLFIVSDVF